MNAASGTAPLGTLSVARELAARARLKVELTVDGASNVIVTVAALANAPDGAVTVNVWAPRVAVADPPLAGIGALVATLVGATVAAGWGVVELPPHPLSKGATPMRIVAKTSRYRKRRASRKK
jgi:hypothetical protein